MTKTLNSRIPEGPVAEKWTNYKAHQRLVNPKNKLKLDVIVVGTGLAGASAAASLGEMGFNVLNFCIQDSPRRAHSIAAQGGINAAKARRRIREAIERQKSENENWYNRRYNEDSLQRADTQRLLNAAEENIRNRNRAAAGRQAVMGGTEDSVAATKEANNEAIANATSRIAVAGEQRKDAVEQQYMSKKDALQQQTNEMNNQRAQNIAQATQAVEGVGNNLISADGIFNSNKKNNE